MDKELDSLDQRLVEVVPYRTCETEYTAFRSQTDENDTSHLRKISSKDKDLGSRSILKDEQHLIWYPAEVDVSIGFVGVYRN